MNSEGNIFAIRSILLEKDLIAYESQLIDFKSFEVVEKREIAQGKNIKVYQVVPNKQLNVVHISFSDRQLVIQEMSRPQAFLRLKFVNLPGTPTPPTCSGAFCYIIPQARVMLKIDTLLALSAVGSPTGDHCINFDMKALSEQCHTGV